MTLATCRQNLVQLLADPDNKVIALSGKWGTGKTHLWKQVRGDLESSTTKGAVAVSLFGLSTVNDLKIKIAEGVLPNIKKGGAIAEMVKDRWVNLKRFMKKVDPRFSILDEVELVALPLLIKDRLLVIDDIERKHEKLSVDEVLGFVDDCVQTLGCRVLLILNSDQLSDPKLWERFREKVIDQELRLDTSPAEAFDIALELTPCLYADQIRPSVEGCGITNIRIIRKIFRVVNRLLVDRDEVPEHVLTRVLPSITLLSAIHYKGLDDGPTTDFVLEFDAMQVALHMMGPDDKRRESPEMKAQASWHLLMNRLKIRSTDGFERLVADYLKTGMFDGSAVGVAIDRFTNEGRQLAMRVRADTFLEHCWWHPELSEHDLLEEVRSMITEVPYLDIYKITAVHDRAVTLRDGTAIAKELVDAWLGWARARREAVGEWEVDDDFDRHYRPLHPRIAEEFQASLDRQQLRVTVLDVCRKVSTHHGWGEREKRCMRAVTPQVYEAAIRSATGDDFRVLMLQSMDFLKNGEAYAQSFGDAPQAFLAACRSIVRQERENRLGQLVRAVFNSAGMGGSLDEGPDAVAEDGSVVVGGKAAEA